VGHVKLLLVIYHGPVGAPRAGSVPDPVTKSGSAATVLDFAVGQIMRDDTATRNQPGSQARNRRNVTTRRS